MSSPKIAELQSVGCKENAMSLASNQEIIRLLMKAGEDIADISTEMKRILTGLKAGDTLDVTELEYQNDFCPRFGKANPQVMEVPFWKEMVRSGISAYGARIQFREGAEQNRPAWCFRRYGCSFTELPDGRFVQIGGEHEDYYDRDFCTGEKPGWIYRHKCRFRDKSLVVSGGKIFSFKDGKEEHDDNAAAFKLDLLTMSWTRQ